MPAAGLGRRGVAGIRELAAMARAGLVPAAPLCAGAAGIPLTALLLIVQLSSAAWVLLVACLMLLLRIMLLLLGGGRQLAVRC